MDIFINYDIEIPPSGLKLMIGIPQQKLFDLIKDSPNQLIDFEVYENIDLETDKVVTNVKVTTMMGEYVLPIEKGDDYPFMKIENPLDFTLGKTELLSGIERTVFACGDDTLRPQLTGVMVKFNETGVCYTATNTHVISSFTFPIKERVEVLDEFIVPNKAFSVLDGLPMDDTIKVSLSERNIKFQITQEISVESILISERFVDYLAVIPTKQKNHLTIRKSQLLGSVKRVSKFSDLGTSHIAIDLSHNKCKITSNNNIGERAEENLVVDYTTGEEIRFGISAAYLMKSLGRIPTDNVSISFDSPMRPIILRDKDENTEVNTKENFILVMPMNLGE